MGEMRVENIQDAILLGAKDAKIPVTIFMMNGFQMRGVVRGVDMYAVLLDSDGKQNLIYKHAISTVQPLHPIATEA